MTASLALLLTVTTLAIVIVGAMVANAGQMKDDRLLPAHEAAAKRLGLSFTHTQPTLSRPEGFDLQGTKRGLHFYLHCSAPPFPSESQPEYTQLSLTLPQHVREPLSIRRLELPRNDGNAPTGWLLGDSRYDRHYNSWGDEVLGRGLLDADTLERVQAMRADEFSVHGRTFTAHAGRAFTSSETVEEFVEQALHIAERIVRVRADVVGALLELWDSSLEPPIAARACAVATMTFPSDPRVRTSAAKHGRQWCAHLETVEERLSVLLAAAEWDRVVEVTRQASAIEARLCRLVFDRLCAEAPDHALEFARIIPTVDAASARQVAAFAASVARADWVAIIANLIVQGAHDVAMAAWERIHSALDELDRPILLALLEKRDVDLRAEAAEALGRVGLPEDVGPLRKLSERRMVKREVAKSAEAAATQILERHGLANAMGGLSVATEALGVGGLSDASEQMHAAAGNREGG